MTPSRHLATVHVTSSNKTLEGFDSSVVHIAVKYIVASHLPAGRVPTAITGAGGTLGQ